MHPWATSRGWTQGDPHYGFDSCWRIISSLPLPLLPLQRLQTMGDEVEYYKAEPGRQQTPARGGKTTSWLCPGLQHGGHSPPGRAQAAGITTNWSVCGATAKTRILPVAGFNGGKNNEYNFKQIRKIVNYCSPTTPLQPAVFPCPSNITT